MKLSEILNHEGAKGANELNFLFSFGAREPKVRFVFMINGKMMS